MTQSHPAHPAVEMVRTNSLKPNPTNARKHSAKNIDQIAGSIGRFDFLVPIVIDDSGMIAAGHGRWEAAKQLKLKTVPVIRAKFMTDEDRRAFALAENRIAELSGWDDEMLRRELSDLFDRGYALEITGFSTSDLDLSIGAVEKPKEVERVELPDPDTEAVSCLGDLWSIRQHRMYCGDACDAVSYEALLAGDLANMVFSDPPYGVKIQGHVSGLGKIRHREFAMMSGEQTPPELIAFFRKMFRLCARFSVGGSIHYQCIDWRHVREMLDAADGVYAEFKQMLVWNKGLGAMGSFYRSQHELILVFKAGKGRHINNFGLGATGRYRTNVLDYPGANVFRKGRAKDLADHPTIKPTALVIDTILDCSNPGDLILDPFSGSGTTLIAAHKAGRRGAAIEIDRLHADTSLRRLWAVTGVEPVLADGRSFTQVEADRKAEREMIDG